MLKRSASPTPSGAPHSSLISHHRKTPTKICSSVTTTASEIQQTLARLLMRAARSIRLTLRRARYISVAEISILIVATRTRRIGPPLVRNLVVSSSWYGFKANLAIGGDENDSAPQGGKAGVR